MILKFFSLIIVIALVPGIGTSGIAVASSAVAKAECRIELLRRAEPEIARFKDEHLYGSAYDDAVSEWDNGAFAKLEGELVAGSAYIRFRLENAVVKYLNDDCFQDKEFTAANLVLFRRLFIEHLTKNTSLMGRVVFAHEGGKYYDFKGPGLIFQLKEAGDHAGIRRELRRVLNATAHHFKQLQSRYPRIVALLPPEHPILGNTLRWNLGATASTRYQVNYAARDLRTQVMSGSSTDSLGEWSDSMAVDISRLVHTMEKLRRRLVERIGSSEVFVEGVPSVETTRILRDADSNRDIRTEAQRREFLFTEFWNAMHVALTDEDLDTFVRYYNIGEKLAPSILISTNQRLDLGDVRRAEGSVFGLDIVGQHQENATEIYRASKLVAEDLFGRDLGMFDDWEHKLNVVEASNRFFVDSYAAQKRASALLDSRIASMFDLAQERLLIPKGDPDGRFVPSGDEIIGLSDRVLSDEEWDQYVFAVAQRSDRGTRFRPTLTSTYYQGTGARLPPAERLKMLARAELIQKDVRKAMRSLRPANGLSIRDLNQVLIAVRAVPLFAGATDIVVHLVPKPGLFPAEKLPALADNATRVLRQEGILPPGFRIREFRIIEPNARVRRFSLSGSVTAP